MTYNKEKVLRGECIMKLVKYHGLGNDYLVFDINKNTEKLDKQAVVKICNRHSGFGSDGILEGPSITEDGFGVKIYNPDGSLAEKSGNGVRIFARYLKDAGYVGSDSCNIVTTGGIVNVTYLDEYGDMMKVHMGRLSFKGSDVGYTGMEEEVVDKTITFGHDDYRCTCVSVGNPHCVILVDKVSPKLVCELGKRIEKARCFVEGVNTQIVEVIDRANVKAEIYERGAGYTLSSGTSCCAIAGAMYKVGLVDFDVNVHMPGGILNIHITKDYDVYLTGPVEIVGTVITPSNS